MIKTVLVTGADGYCGWPVLLKLAKDHPDWRIFGVDNGFRRRWVKEVGAQSVMPIARMDRRIKTARKAIGSNIELAMLDFSGWAVVHHTIEQLKPDIIIHLAAQPSAPYSSKSAAHCSFTQCNNISMLTNIMFALNKLQMNDTHLIVTTTTGVYGAPSFKIPEGDFSHELPYPAMGGSWYHMSRAFDAANLWLAAKQFKFPITELRTAIVCGSSTPETKLHPKLANRFDVDFYFGVVVNRFIAMSLTGHPLTVYGKGLQRKPMISLEDMVRSTCNACLIREKQKLRKYEIFNQMQETVSIVSLAKYVIAGTKGKLEHVDNPRVEDEEHQMEMDNDKFYEMLLESQFSQTIEQSVHTSIKDLDQYKNRIKTETFMR